MKPYAPILLSLGMAAGIGFAAAAQDVEEPADTAVVTPDRAKRCIPTNRIIGYVVESDEVVRLQMKGRTDVMVHLRRVCPQLHYHAYIAFTPVNGELCAGHDDIVTRTGLPCKIESFTEVPRGTPFDEEGEPAETDGTGSR